MASTQPAADQRQWAGSMRPIADADFGFDEARHLLWRAGFGGTPEQVQTLASWGPERAVAYLVDYNDIPYEEVTGEEFDKDIMRPPSQEERLANARARRGGDENTLARFRAQQQERERRDRVQITQMQRWWIKRMIETPRPFEEKLTLFWHGHFATSYRTIENSYHMLMQNQHFRANAAGDFRRLLFGIIRDPAMLAYLDNNDSRVGRPNENLARELMELFSLGVGNYTEDDIKEGARALTGYTFADDEFVFNERNHDQNPKSIFGRRGRIDGDGFVTAILENPACSRFIAAKLYRLLVHDYPTGRPELDKPAQEVIRDMANTMLRYDYSMRPMFKRLLASRHFYQARLRCEQIKSPATLVVGAVRSLLTPVRDLGVLADAMNLMGQHVFFPPSVAGWAGGRSWINTSTLFVRQNILCYLLTGKLPVGYDALADRDKYDGQALLSSLNEADAQAARDPEKAAEYLLRFALGQNSPRDRASVAEFISGHGGRLSGDVLTATLLLITAMPEYQLC